MSTMLPTTVATHTLRPYQIFPFLENSPNMVPEGHRLSVIRWKQTTDKKTGKVTDARSAICVVIPSLLVDVSATVLTSAVNEAIAEMQDNCVRDFINGKIEENTSINLTSLVVPDSLVTSEGIAVWASQKALNGRLSKEAIGQWFDSFLAEPLMIKLMEMDDKISEEKLRNAIGQHKKFLSDLASPKASMPEKLVIPLQKALKLVAGRDKVRDILDSKLAGFLKKEDSELELGL